MQPATTRVYRTVGCTVIGHGAIAHGCTIGDNVLVGMGAIVMNGVHVGKEALIGAGALVPEGGEVPPGSPLSAFPPVKRALTDQEIAQNRDAGVREIGKQMVAQASPGANAAAKFHAIGIVNSLTSCAAERSRWGRTGWRRCVHPFTAAASTHSPEPTSVPRSTRSSVPPRNGLASCSGNEAVSLNALCDRACIELVSRMR